VTALEIITPRPTHFKTMPQQRKRKKGAVPLPSGITQSMLPKYVTYNRELSNKEKGIYREYFRLEGHPKLTKRYVSSTKSNRVSIQDKLAEIKKKLSNLEAHGVADTYLIPKQYSVQKSRGAPTLVYEKVIGRKHVKMRMKLDPTKSVEDEVKRLKERLAQAHPSLTTHF